MNISTQSSCQSFVTENRAHHVKVKDGCRIGQAVGDASLSLAPVVCFGEDITGIEATIPENLSWVPDAIRWFL
jgi:hypothetical protein